VAKKPELRLKRAQKQAKQKEKEQKKEMGFWVKCKEYGMGALSSSWDKVPILCYKIKVEDETLGLKLGVIAMD
jgi:hypothetical protein